MPASSRLLRTEAPNSTGSRPSRIDWTDHDAELHERRAHHERHQRERKHHGGRRGQAAQPHRRHELAARRELGVPGAPAQEPLEREQRERHRHEQRGELQRRVAVEGARTRRGRSRR